MAHLPQQCALVVKHAAVRHRRLYPLRRLRQRDGCGCLPRPPESRAVRGVAKLAAVAQLRELALARAVAYALAPTAHARGRGRTRGPTPHAAQEARVCWGPHQRKDPSGEGAEGLFEHGLRRSRKREGDAPPTKSFQAERGVFSREELGTHALRAHIDDDHRWIGCHAERRAQSPVGLGGTIARAAVQTAFEHRRQRGIAQAAVRCTGCGLHKSGTRPRPLRRLRMERAATAHEGEDRQVHAPF